MVAALALLAALGFGGCAQSPQEIKVSHGKEYFPSAVYGRASRRVIADGQPVPRGGGQYLVGKPYTIAGRTYYPSESTATQVGSASWYGDAFHGRLTANGEIYDRDAFTAASPTMPLPSYARVTNLRNNYSMIVRVNDRGPYHSDRIMDVSRRVAEALDYKRYGTTRLKVEYVGRASLAGSDDNRLYATLRTDRPATGQAQPTMVASAAPRTRIASTVPYVAEAKPVADEPPVRRRISRPARITAEDEAQEEPVAHRRAASDEPTHLQDRGSFAEEEPEAPRPRSRSGREYIVGSYARNPVREESSGTHRFAARDITPPVRPRYVERSEPMQLARVKPLTRYNDAKFNQASRHDAIMPPSRPMDLGTIPGAGVPIHAPREPARLHVARSHYD